MTTLVPKLAGAAWRDNSYANHSVSERPICICSRTAIPIVLLLCVGFQETAEKFTLCCMVVGRDAEVHPRAVVRTFSHPVSCSNRAHAFDSLSQMIWTESVA
jgi:hypothetical protein